MLSIFPYASWSSVWLKKMSLQIFCSFLVKLFMILLLSCMNYLCIVDNTPFWIYVLQIFSHIHKFGFLIFLFFWCLPLLCSCSLVWCNPTCLFIYFFFILSFLFFESDSADPKKPLPRSLSGNLFPMFSSKHFGFQSYI